MDVFFGVFENNAYIDIAQGMGLPFGLRAEEVYGRNI